ncbi:MAG: DEAD/DEAH box helicase [Erysipelotrichaceae bacterium]|nr:DEAD/DEAH box helicase [Erysipelotrichaceae bacterium]
MKCRICGNQDSNLFFEKDGDKVCRVCLKYKYPIVEKENKAIRGYVNLNYQLTKEQEEISMKLLDLVKIGKSVLINAVCGAGKTEIMYRSIIWALDCGKRVGVAIPRKDVVEELYQRMRNDLSDVSIVRVYGGKTTDLEADVVIFTTHQAYRYVSCFDLLFVDEVDAFPFYGNEVLRSILKSCCLGSIVYMSATINKIDNVSVLTLNKRYHGFPIPIPKVIISFCLRKRLLSLLVQLLSSKIVIIYVGSIKEGLDLFSFLKKFYGENVIFINSKDNKRNTIVKQIKKYHFKVVISTTILERGITLKDVQIVVYGANNDVFDVSTLIQIVGRVGRKADYPDGKVYFLSNSRCSKFKKVIKIIQNANK